MPSDCDPLIEDIEDMVSSGDPTPHERQSARKNIIPRARKKKEPLNNEELQADRYFESSTGWSLETVPSGKDDVIPAHLRKLNLGTCLLSRVVEYVSSLLTDSSEG